MSEEEIIAEMARVRKLMETKEGRFQHLKNMLEAEQTTVEQQAEMLRLSNYKDYKFIPVLPILHNEFIILLMCGWSINLNPDGTWYWEDTTGG